MGSLSVITTLCTSGKVSATSGFSYSTNGSTPTMGGPGNSKEQRQSAPGTVLTLLEHDAGVVTSPVETVWVDRDANGHGQWAVLGGRVLGQSGFIQVSEKARKAVLMVRPNI